MKPLIFLILFLIAFNANAAEHCQWTFSEPPVLVEYTLIRQFPHEGKPYMAPCKQGWCKGQHGYRIVFRTYLYNRPEIKSKFPENFAHTTSTFINSPYNFRPGEIIETRWIGKNGNFFFF